MSNKKSSEQRAKYERRMAARAKLHADKSKQIEKITNLIPTLPKVLINIISMYLPPDYIIDEVGYTIIALTNIINKLLLCRHRGDLYGVNESIYTVVDDVNNIINPLSDSDSEY
jgi:hypothetical protein